MKGYENKKVNEKKSRLQVNEVAKEKPAKRVSIVSVELVKESSMLYRERKICSPEDGYRLMKQFLRDADRKHLVVVCLDTKNQPTAINICHIGSLNASIVHPRECFKPAILCNSASIIALHNHPFGNCYPSREDIEVKKRLLEAGKILEIDLLDHILVGDGKYVSLKEKGYIQKERRNWGMEKLDWFVGILESDFAVNSGLKGSSSLLMKRLIPVVM